MVLDGYPTPCDHGEPIKKLRYPALLHQSRVIRVRAQKS
jgi:hypothetical protein